MKKFFLLYKSLVEVFWACPKYNTGMFFVLVLMGVMPALNIYATGKLVNLFENNIITESSIIFIIGIWGLSMLLPTLLSPLVNYLQSHINQLVTNKIIKKIIYKNSTFNGLQSFDDVDIQNSINILKTQSKFRPTNFLVNSVIIIRELITIISLAIILFHIKWWIPIALLISSIPLAYINFSVASFSWKALMKSSHNTRLMEYFTSLSFSREAQKDIHLFDAHYLIYQKYNFAFEKVYQELKSTQLKTFAKPIPFQIITAISISFILYVIYKQSTLALITISSVVVLLQSIVLLNNRLEGFIEHSSLLYEVLSYFEHYFNFLNTSDTVKDGTEEIDIIESIEFRNVYFKYPNSKKYVINNVSFSAKVGESIAIVGHNGAGKSTLIYLICRFWDVTEGEILINNKNIKNYKLADLRNCIGAVLQDFFKFNLTIHENITFQSNDNLDINYSHKIGLPNDISTTTIIGKSFGGIELSGGQWQKLAILRCFHTNGSLVILDEPTSAIDPKSEVELYNEFKKISENKLTFMVTHRLGSVNNTDRVLVFDQGQLVQNNTPNELKNTDGLFKDLWNLQANMYKK